MPNFNKVTLAGHVGLDPEVRYAASGTCICSFSLATSWGKKKENGTWDNFTDWHKVVTFGKQAEFCAEKVAKGVPVLVVGEIRYESWEDNEGNKRYATKIIAQKVNILISAPKSEPAVAKDVDEGDDLPF